MNNLQLPWLLSQGFTQLAVSHGSESWMYILHMYKLCILKKVKIVNDTWSRVQLTTIKDRLLGLRSTTLAAKCSRVLFCRKASANATAPDTEVLYTNMNERLQKSTERLNCWKFLKMFVDSNMDWLGFDGRVCRCDPISRQTSVLGCLPPRSRLNKAARLANLGRCVA